MTSQTPTSADEIPNFVAVQLSFPIMPRCDASYRHKGSTSLWSILLRSSTFTPARNMATHTKIEGHKLLFICIPISSISSTSYIHLEILVSQVAARSPGHGASPTGTGLIQGDSPELPGEKLVSITHQK